MTKTYIFSFLCILTIGISYSSQKVHWAGGLSHAEHLQIQLVTIDPGDALTSWWGHTAIVVEDTFQQKARFYNYGLFSFEQDNFVLNFIQGRLIFWVGEWDAPNALLYYRSMNRTIRIQYLNLTPQMRSAMAQYLAEDVRPENREYLYDHYLDNCATRVRDLFDKVSDGAFAAAMKIPGSMTFREHTRRHTARNIFMDWLLMFLMNDDIDQPILRWNEMFLPTELERAAADFFYTDPNAQLQPFVKESSIFYQAQSRSPVPDQPPVHLWWALFFSCLLAGISFVILSLRKEDSRFSVILSIFIGVMFGVPGLILFFLGLFTDHTVTYGNENLFYANPFTFLYLLLGIGLLYKKKPFFKWMQINVICTAILALTGLILKIFPAFDQNNWLAAVTVLPFLTVNSIFILRAKNKLKQ